MITYQDDYCMNELDKSEIVTFYRSIVKKLTIEGSMNFTLTSKKLFLQPFQMAAQTVPYPTSRYKI